MRSRLLQILFFVLCINASSLEAMTIKVGSIAPEGSPWDQALKKIAAQWNKISGGSLILKIYPGGIVGAEPDMIRKMRIGQLQGAIFTGVGMSYISPEVLSLSLPFLVDKDDELDFLMSKTTPYFDGLIKKKGFHVVAWSKAGWVNIFTKKPAIYPADLKVMPLAVSEADPEMLQSWRAIGFNAVPLPTNDIMTGLQSGMIDAYYAPPLVSAAFQWFGYAPHMSDLRMAPMVGGFVLTNKTWDQIPAEIKEQLITVTKQIIKELYADTLRLEKEAIATMKKHGLKIHHVPADIVQLWRKESEKGYDVFIGKTFPRSFYDELKKNISDYRNKK
jgi:TRAP-type C4-dicarboxylate transport system substrate-binding protein